MTSGFRCATFGRMAKATDQRSGRIAYEPALDGLRGIGLFWVFFYHSEFTWAIGGFLSIATFFTLSGYIITCLFLVEHERSGRIGLSAFWGRRSRRLMPASLLTLAFMPLFAVYVATPAQLEQVYITPAHKKCQFAT